MVSEGFSSFFLPKAKLEVLLEVGGLAEQVQRYLKHNHQSSNTRRKKVQFNRHITVLCSVANGDLFKKKKGNNKIGGYSLIRQQ